MNISEHIFLTMLWLAWCAVHSLLISNSCMRIVARSPVWLQRWYRMLYVLFSIVSLVPILLYQRGIPHDVYWIWHWPWSFLQWTGLVAAAVLFVTGARSYDQWTFFGFRQIAGQARETLPRLRVDGILSRVRHPYYSGGILVLLFWGEGDSASLVMRVVGIAYLIVGTEIEERKLILQFGEEYRAYRKRVPRFIPILSRRQGEV